MFKSADCTYEDIVNHKPVQPCASTCVCKHVCVQVEMTVPQSDAFTVCDI